MKQLNCLQFSLVCQCYSSWIRWRLEMVVIDRFSLLSLLANWRRGISAADAGGPGKDHVHQAGSCLKDLQLHPDVQDRWGLLQWALMWTRSRASARFEAQTSLRKSYLMQPKCTWIQINCTDSFIFKFFFLLEQTDLWVLMTAIISMRRIS